MTGAQVACDSPPFRLKDTVILTACVHVLLPVALLFQGLRIVQRPADVPVPGAVRLQSGIQLKGMVSLTRTLDPEVRKQVSELRRIDQGFRRYYISSRVSDPAVEDSAVNPSLEFSIRRRPGRARMPSVIGVPDMTPFDPQGEAVVTLTLAKGKKETIRVGVTRINRNMVEVTGLTHRWRFGMALSAIPDGVLFPGLLEQAVGFEDGGIRLNMAGMLTDANRIQAAAALLDNVQQNFPELEPQIENSRRILRQRTASRILEELQRRMAAGQFENAARSARLFPDEDLTPQVRVAVRNLVSDYDTRKRRVEVASAALQQTLAALDSDQARRQQAREMITSLRSELDVHSIDRLTTWELFSTDESSSAESRVALAVSGWLLGADNAIQGFSECYGLYQIRQLVTDFVGIDPADDVAIGALVRSISAQEGYTVERVAQILRNMPPAFALPLRPAANGSRTFHVSADTSGMHCIGIVPTAYTPNRRYPLLIAIPRQGVSPADTLQWWSRQADRFGVIVAVPEVLPQNSEDYTADAAHHAGMLRLMRRLKLGLSINDDKVFIGGHGVGGEIAMDMASSHTDLFAGVISVAGLGRHHLQWSAHNSADLSWYIVVGERQQLWYPRLEMLLTKLFTRVSSVRRFSNVRLARYPERGFESFSDELPALFEWMDVNSREPWPEKIDVNVMRSTDLSCHWIRLNSLPVRFQGLENPTTLKDGVSRFSSVEASLSKNNGIRVRAPAGGVILLSPDMPGLDPTADITIIAPGKDKRIEFKASVRDLLDEFSRTGERTRLSYMTVPFGR